ncbi:hypothetical protein ACFL2W_00030, partial [Candidatus Omnitrophota bacterium]
EEKDARIFQLTSKMETVSQEEEARKESLQQAKQSVEELKEQLAAQKSTAQSAQEQNKQFATRLEEKDSFLQDLNTQVIEATRKEAGLKDSLLGAEQQIKSLKEKLTNQKDLASNLKEQKESFDITLQGKNDVINQLTSQIEQVRRDREDLKSSLSQADEAISRLKEKVAGVDEQTSSLAFKIEGKDAYIRELKAKMENDAQKAQSLKDSLYETDKQVAELKEELAAQKASIEIITREKKALNRKIQQNEDIVGELSRDKQFASQDEERMKDSLAEAQLTVERQRAQLKIRDEDLTRVNQFNEELQFEIKTKEDLIRKLTGRMDEATERKLVLETRLEGLEGSSDGLLKRLKEREKILEERVLQLTRENQEKEREAKDAIIDLRIKEEELSALQSKLSRLEPLRDTIRDTRGKESELQDELAEAYRELRRLRSDNEGQVSFSDSKGRKIAQLTEELQRKEKLLVELQRELQEKEVLVERQKRQYLEEARLKDSEIQRLRATIRSAIQRIEKATQQ